MKSQPVFEAMEVLGIKGGEELSSDQLKSAYRRQCRLYHPDINPAPDANERFLRIQAAYNSLSYFMAMDQGKLPSGVISEADFFRMVGRADLSQMTSSMIEIDLEAAAKQAPFLGKSDGVAGLSASAVMKKIIFWSKAGNDQMEVFDRMGRLKSKAINNLLACAIEHENAGTDSGDSYWSKAISRYSDEEIAANKRIATLIRDFISDHYYRIGERWVHKKDALDLRTSAEKIAELSRKTLDPDSHSKIIKLISKFATSGSSASKEMKGVLEAAYIRQKKVIQKAKQKSAESSNTLRELESTLSSSDIDAKFLIDAPAEEVERVLSQDPELSFMRSHIESLLEQVPKQSPDEKVEIESRKLQGIKQLIADLDLLALQSA